MTQTPARSVYDKTARYARFVAEYIKDYNATQAYLRAFPGSKYKTAQVQSHYLRKVPEVAAMIERQTANRIKLTEVTAERITLELARIGLSDVRKTVKATMLADGTISEQPLMLHELDEDTARAIKEIEFDPYKGTKLKLHSKENALGMLAKITGAIKPSNGMRMLPAQASVISSDAMLDEEINAALAELEAGDDSDGQDDLIDMDDEGNALLDPDMDTADE